MKTKEEIIAVIEKIKSLNIALSVADYEVVLHYLKLSTLNPMRIDEERMNDISMSLYEERISPMSDMKRMIDKYNSTCKDHQVLQPLPENPPDWFNKMFNWASPEDSRKIWSEIINHYGTPTKKELVSVEKLDEEICALHRVIMPATSKLIAQHIVDTYSLNPPKREWWMDLKYGEWYKDHGNHKSVFSHVALISTNGGISNIQNCTPCIEPSIHDKVKEKLGIELYEEFMKEVKGA